MEKHPNPRVAVIAAIVLIVMLAVAGILFLRLQPTEQPDLAEPTPTPSASASASATSTPVPVEIKSSYLFTDNASSEETSTIYLVTGTDKKALITIDQTKDDGKVSISAALSPDGKFVTYTDIDWNVVRYTIATGESTVLKKAVRDLENVGNMISFAGVTYSPDGKYLGLTWYGWEISGIAIMQADGTGFNKFDKGVEGDSISWSPDSKQFAISSTNNEFGGSPAGLYVASVTAPDSGKQILPSEIQVNGGAYYRDVHDATWSPDGTRLAFGYSYKMMSDLAQEGYMYRGVYVINTDGTGFKQVSSNLSYSTAPLWKDNSTLYYGLSNAFSGKDQKGIFSINVDGTSNTQVFRGLTNAYAPRAFSPDQKFLIYEGATWSSSSTAPYSQLYLLDLTTGKSTLLLELGKQPWIPAFGGWSKS